MKDVSLRINHRIRASEVRVLNHDGELLGVMSTRAALLLAQDEGLDLVEISPSAKPPVCKITDYGKLRYEAAKRAKPAPRNETKEVKFRPRTEAHDLAHKSRAVTAFLEEGHRVRLVVSFRGREAVHPELGVAILLRVVEAVGATAEGAPVSEGRNVSLLIRKS